MAFYDDRKFLLSHIHHSFITSDDTGVCETVMVNEAITSPPTSDYPDIPELKCMDYVSSAMDSEFLDGGHSYDVATDLAHMGPFRLRSNTAQRLDRLKREKQLQAKIKNVQWRESDTVLDEKELEDLFPKKDVSKREAPLQKTSVLAEMLEQYPVAPNNPFSAFSRFDGRMTQVAQTTKILIYLTMLPPERQNYPLEVVCLANARVQDLIGLICWQYTLEIKEPALIPNASNYCLRIAEETGEVDEDFPNLDPKELVAKFGFPFLALVEKSCPETDAFSITIRIENEFTKLEIPSQNVTLREVIDQIRKRRKWLKKTTNFHVESIHETGIPLNLDSSIADLAVYDFLLVIEEGSTNESIMDDWNNQQLAIIEAPMYKSFNVVLTQKMGRNSDVQLGVSEEKVEISPLPPRGAAKILSRQQKPMTFYMNKIANCEIISKKYSPGKCVFRIVHKSGPDFKNLTFESDPQTGQDVVKKLQIILDMRFNDVRKEYQVYRERKLQKKMQKSLHSLSF